MRFEFDVSGALDLPEPVVLVVDLFAPEAAPKGMVFCYPGGGCSRAYFNLQVKHDDSYSLARKLANAGYFVCTVDHLGVGESTRPENGLSVTIERVVTANQALVDQVIARVLGHRLVPGDNLPLRKLPVLLVGHSMGAFLALKQQDRFHTFDGLALLGFGHSGMPEVLCDHARDLAARTAQLEEIQVELAACQFGTGYVDIPAAQAGETRAKAPNKVHQALYGCRTPLITVPGSVVLVPGAALRESHRVSEPVFVANGSRDLAGPAEAAAREYGASRQVTILELSGAGHMHFVHESRGLLMNALVDWSNGLSL